VFNSKDPRSNAVGRWIMRYSEVKNLSPAEIKDRFSLESEPDYMVDANIPAGQEMEASTAGENAWGKGGGIQFRIISKVVEGWFSKTPVPIQATVPDVNPESIFKSGTGMPEELPTLPEGEVLP